MKTLFASSMLALALAGAGVTGALADGRSQLVAHLGADAGTSLDALAAMKFNQDSDRSDWQTVVSGRSMPGTSALDAAAQRHFVGTGGSEDAQGYDGAPRSIIVVGGRHGQLIAASGLTDAAGATLDAVAAAKIAGEDHEGSGF